MYDTEVMKSLVKSLDEMKYNVSKCIKIDEAKQRIKNDKLDILILDIMMNYGKEYEYDDTDGGFLAGYKFLCDFRN